jgi:hypothetical protein
MLRKRNVAVLSVFLALLCPGFAARGQNVLSLPARATNGLVTSIDKSGPGSFNSSSSSLHEDEESSAVFVMRPPIRRSKKTREPRGSRPFSTIAVGFKADTLGSGVEIATPLSRNLNLRTGINLLDFGYTFNIDGLDYDSKLHFRSAQTTIDWFPWHGRFHISPGVLYAKNTLSAVASVPAGEYFELGSQGLINTVDDPINGTASVALPHKIAPMLLAGFGDIIPRSGRHLSIPMEFGFALTGAPRIKVDLNGTACTTQGCFDIQKDPDSQKGLVDEVAKLNGNLGKIAVYPIVSVGCAYRF